MTMTSSQARDATALFQLSPGKWVQERTLKQMLTSIELALFFAKAYKLNFYQLGDLLRITHGSTSVVAALLSEGGNHSVDLQDYIVDTLPAWVYPETGITYGEAEIDDGELLAQMWELAEVEVAKSIQDVADKLSGTLDLLPGKQGELVFSHMQKLNKQRPTIGRYSPSVYHKPAAMNLVILDVSGSMTESTVRRIITDVVALAYKADASLAIVSNRTFFWEPGHFNVDDVLAKAEYGGTQYETLQPVLEQDWGTVITIADYDSSRGAKDALRKCSGRIETVLDISLVNRVTFLAECVGQLANEIKPLLVGSSQYVLS